MSKTGKYSCPHKTYEHRVQMKNNKPNKYITKYNTKYYYKLKKLHFAK